MVVKTPKLLKSERQGAKLSPADFRFVSAWVQGIDVMDAWQRFQTHRGTGDLRRIRSTVRGILDQLQAIAVRHGDVQAAALLRRDSSRISVADKLPKKSPTSDGAVPMPTLAQFTAELCRRRLLQRG